MKQSFLVLLFILNILTSSQGQDVIVSDSVKSYYKLIEQLKLAHNPDMPITLIDSLYSLVFNSTLVSKEVIANQYEGYALL